MSGGSIVAIDGREFVIVGYYEPLHPRAPQSILIYDDRELSIRSIVMEVDTVKNGDSVVSNTMRLFGLDPATTSIVKYGGVAEISQEIGETQREYTALTVETTLIATALIVAFISALMVNARKQEFGRRRVLGASRRFLVGMVTIQVMFTVAVACVLGIGIGFLIVVIAWPLGTPSASYCVGLAGTLIIGSVAAQMPSALLAAFRDPVAVLRSP